MHRAHSTHFRCLVRPPLDSLLALLVCASSAACAVEPSGSGIVDECTGKCDGAGDELVAVVRRPSAAEWEDFLAIGAKFATEELTDVLRFSESGISGGLQSGGPDFYALSETAAREPTVEDLDVLVSGLADRFGERELTVAVNEERRRYLEAEAAAMARDSSYEGDRYFAETTFGWDGALFPAWSLSVPGFEVDEDGSATTGFRYGRQRQARLVAPYPSKRAATLDGNPFAALIDKRGFVLPRTPLSNGDRRHGGLEDFRAMKPGELWAWSAGGTMGFTFGGSFPIVTADIATGFLYRLVAHGGLDVNLRSDKMDIQWAKLAHDFEIPEDDEVVVDIGLRDVERDGVRFGVRGSFGIDEIIELDVNGFGWNVDLGSLIENALENALNDTIGHFEAYYENHGNEERRMSVARVRFRLHEQGEWNGWPADAVEKALSQAVHGDVRLAQALHNAGHPGVHVDFDLSRSGHSKTERLGLGFLGMRFETRHATRNGHLFIQEEDAARSIIYDYLEDESAAFWWSRTFARTALSSIEATPDRASQHAAYFLRFEDEDDHVDRSKILDHTDGIVLALGGPGVMKRLEDASWAIHRAATAACRSLWWDHYDTSQAGSDGAPDDKFEWCREQLLHTTHDHHASRDTIEKLENLHVLRRDALDLLEADTSRLPEEHAKMVRAAGKLRIAAYSSVIRDGFSGPDVEEIAIDVHLFDEVLHYLLGRRPGEGISGIEFARAIAPYLAYANTSRNESPSELADDEREEVECGSLGRIPRIACDTPSDRVEYAYGDHRREVPVMNRELLEKMADRWDVFRAKYHERRRDEQLELPDGLGNVGERAMLIQFSSDALEERHCYEEWQHRCPQPTLSDLYETATLTSVAHWRAQVVGDMFEELLAEADDIGDEETWRSNPGGRILLYGVLQLLPQELVDMRFRFRLNADDSGPGYVEMGFDRYLDERIEGPRHQLGGERFDIHALVTQD